MEKKSRSPFADVLYKGKKYPPGTVRTLGGVKKIKKADGSWVPVDGSGPAQKKKSRRLETRSDKARHHLASVEAKREVRSHSDSWAKKYAEAYAEALRDAGITNAKVWQKKAKGRGTYTRVYFYRTFLEVNSEGVTDAPDNEAFKQAHMYRSQSKKMAAGDQAYMAGEKRERLKREQNAQIEGDRSLRAQCALNLAKSRKS